MSNYLEFLWGILNSFFVFIEDGFRAMFPYLPPSSIPFTVAIFCYSVLAFLIWCINLADTSVKQIGFKIIYYSFSVMVIMMFLWKIGLITLIPSSDVVSNVSELFITLFYVGFGILLIYSFLKNISWLKHGILIFTWGIFLLDVFVIAPIFGETPLNEHTIVSVLVLVIIFVVPNGLNVWSLRNKNGAEKSNE